MASPPVLSVRVSSEAALETLLAEVETHGGLMVEVPEGEAPPQFSAVEVSLVAPHGEIARVKAQLVQLLGPGQAAVLLDVSERERVRGARFRGELAEDDGAAEEAEGAPEEEPPPDDGSPPPRDLPLWARWEDLTKPERIKVARYGNADARRMVLKDKDAMLHRMVLNNPGLTPSELVALLKSGAASSALVRAVTERHELVANISVADALVHSPHTPLDIAVRLVAKVPLESAKRIAKAGNLRAQIVGAARKRVLR